MGNRLAPASRHPEPEVSPGPSSNHGGDSSDSIDGDGDGDVLPPDVLFDILLRLRLPGKQLCRLRGVCRSWRAVLSDPHFAAAHAACHPDILVVGGEAELLVDACSAGRVVRRGTSCPNGPWRTGYNYPQMRAHLGRVLIVGAGPLLRVVDPDTGAGADSLLPAHGDHDSTSFFVLGWAASAGSGKGDGGYKVLSITRDRRGIQFCKVLALGAGGDGAGDVWREAQNTPVDVRDQPWAATVANRGVVYILGRHRRIGAEWIAAFDLKTERWRRGLVRGPPSNALSGLTEMEGRLAAVSGSFSYASAVHLWLCLDDDVEAAWHKVCTVPVSRIQRCPRNDRMAEHLWVLDGGRRIVFLVWSPRLLPGGGVAGYTNSRWVLRVYDLRSKSFEDVAQTSYYTDVAIGVYSANNLLRVY